MPASVSRLRLLSYHGMRTEALTERRFTVRAAAARRAAGDHEIEQSMSKRIISAVAALVVFGVAGGAFLFLPRTSVVVRPGDDLQKALDAVAESGTIVLQDGDYQLTRPLQITRPGVTLKAAHPRAARLVAAEKFAKHPKTNKGAMIRVDSPNVTLSGLVLDGRFVTLLKAIDASDTDDQESLAHGLIVDDCEVFHFAHHAIDIDADDAVVRNCLIYEILWDEFGVRHDAHGIVTTNGQRLTIDSCTIRNCSGDCIQGERGVWDNLIIINCDLSDGPLPRDLGGFKQGTVPGENAFDSKHAIGSRGRVAIVSCKLHGFRTRLRVYTAAVVLKENVDAVIDSCDIYDSTIALRLRGVSHGMPMRPVVMNTIIHGNDLAFRLEDQLEKFRLLHCTIFDNKQQTVWAPGGVPWKGIWDNSGWALQNNLWIEPSLVPELATDKSLGAKGNLVVARNQVNDQFVPLDPAPGIELAPVVDQWYEATGRVVRDKSGKMRTSPPTTGALEHPDT